GARYTWNTGDTTQTINVFQNSGYYSVVVDAGPNCVAEDSIYVEVSPLPSVVGISYVKTGNTYQFSPSGAQNTTRYLWIFGNVHQDTNRHVTYTYGASQQMEVMLVVFNDCGSDTSWLELPVNVAHTQSGEYQLDLYPNPAISEVNLSIQGGNARFHDVVIIDGLGQVLYRSEPGDYKEMRLDVNNFANGHYMLRATVSDGSVISKPFNIIR